MEFDRLTRERKMANELQTTDRNGKIPDLQFKESRAHAAGDCEADWQIGVDDKAGSRNEIAASVITRQNKRIGCALIAAIQLCLLFGSTKLNQIKA